MSRYGNHFERKAIMAWLNSGNNFCPVTGNPLRPANLVSDKTLQWKINYWAKKHGYEIKNDAASTEVEDKMTSVCFLAIPPDRFICPLTKEIMKEPVCTRQGKNFERKAILKWLEQKGDICPVTKQPLRMSGLIANSKLQWEIQQWQLSTGDSSELMSDLELQGKLSKAEMVSRDFALSDIFRALTNIEDESKPATVEKEVEKTDVLSVLDDVINAI